MVSGSNLRRLEERVLVPVDSIYRSRRAQNPAALGDIFRPCPGRFEFLLEVQ